MKLVETVTHNLGLKLLSLFLAAVLWLFVTASHDEEIGLSCPVACANIPPGLAIVNRLPTQVDVRLAGPRILLLRLKSERPTVLLDLRGLGEGLTSFPEVETKFRIPYGVRVTRVTPASIEVRLAKTGSPVKNP